MERKLNKKRVIIVGAAVLALLLIIGGCITLFTSCGGSKKSKTQPLLCEEPAFPATLKANGGEYTRKLSTYWWVKDVKNGKVILEDVNRFHGGAAPDADLGVVDLQGRVIITCDNRDVHFTDKGYSATTIWAETASRASTLSLPRAMKNSAKRRSRAIRTPRR